MKFTWNHEPSESKKERRIDQQGLRYHRESPAHRLQSYEGYDA